MEYTYDAEKEAEMVNFPRTAKTVITTGKSEEQGGGGGWKIN